MRPVSSGLPFFDVGGALGFGRPTLEPQGRGDTTVVWNDTLTWLKGRHTFAFGGEARRAYNNNIAFNVGSLTYTSPANFLADQASQFTVQLGSGKPLLPKPGIASLISIPLPAAYFRSPDHIKEQVSFALAQPSADPSTPE